MQVQIQKWGNSLTLRIPQAFVQEAQMEPGTTVEVFLKQGSIVIEPLPEKEYALEELLTGVTPENIHGEISLGPPRFDLAGMVSRIPADYQVEEVSFGPPVGREEW